MLARLVRDVIGDDVVLWLGLRLRFDHRFSRALLGRGEGPCLHPGELTRRLLHGAIQEPDEPSDEEHVDRGNDNERPAEAGF